MDEMVAILEQIRDLLVEMNEKLDDIKGYGVDTSISDVCDKLDTISGMGIYTLSDVCSKIDEVKGSGLYDSISDVCAKLDAIDTTIMVK